MCLTCPQFWFRWVLENLASPESGHRRATPRRVILPQMVTDIRVPRAGGGRARLYPGAVLTGRAYRSEVIHMAIAQRFERIQSQ